MNRIETPTTSGKNHGSCVVKPFRTRNAQGQRNSDNAHIDGQLTDDIVLGYILSVGYSDKSENLLVGTK